MNRAQIISILSIILFLILIFAYAGADSQPEIAIENDFGSYWYQGKAELSRYDLHQVRYGQIHNGDAVLIFVTEDFLPEKQVKYEYGPAPDNLAKVLKLNFTRKFYTGIYPYSMMSSVFTPLNESRTFKVTTTVQEWCGHTFLQLNARKDKYHGRLYSYFQGEGDSEFELDNVILEDEVWTKLRLNPGNLPIGEIKIIPGTQYQRLLHIEPAVHQAVTTMNSMKNGHSEYRIEYSSLKRSLIIRFDSEFPHQISEWEEIHEPVLGQGNMMITRATRTNSILLDYWNKNRIEDKVLLDQLGLN